ncbi:MAG TPA: NAD(P)-dependent alcohol dehydrogenase [Chitinophagaceae bacterium]|nr:NAD(P)-dependent alcohol dehydrogenase [Chitinophagaceae bacterium]
MKAVVRSKYGSPDHLKIQEVEKPSPGNNEVLIRVNATTVNRTDCGILWGNPFIIRFFIGLLKPKYPFTGTDFAGTIESVGKNVKGFKAGDRVWGFTDNASGTHAQYIKISEDKALAIIPDNINYEQAAASAEGAHYAYNCIKKAKLSKGQNVLVYGATGAIGTAAVQILKYLEAIVTAVCNTKNMDLMKSLGADKVVDYTKDDFTKDDQKYHFVLDAVGKSTFAKCKPLLHAGGIYISTDLGPMAQNIFLPLITPLIGNKKVIFPIPGDVRGSILFIKDLLQKEKFKPVIDRKYPFEKIADAFKFVATGQKTGNVVINWEDDINS